MQDMLKDLLLQAMSTEGGIEKMYNEMTKEFKPFINSLPKFAKPAGKDAATLVQTVLKVVNEVGDNEEVQAELKALKTRQIKRRKEILEEYKKAGFTATQAFEMLRLDVMNAKAVIANASSSVKFGK